VIQDTIFFFVAAFVSIIILTLFLADLFSREMIFFVFFLQLNEHGRQKEGFTLGNSTLKVSSSSLLRSKTCTLLDTISIHFFV
jgi:hypothetical protein